MLKHGGHNHLRISRIIRSLALCGQHELSNQFQKTMLETAGALVKRVKPQSSVGKGLLRSKILSKPMKLRKINENVPQGSLGGTLDFCFGTKVGQTAPQNIRFYTTKCRFLSDRTSRIWAYDLVLFHLFPIKDNFAGKPATHSVKTFLEVIDLEVVSDNWRQI